MRELAGMVLREIAKVQLEIDIHENEYLEQIGQKALHEGEERGIERGQEINARGVLPASRLAGVFAVR